MVAGGDISYLTSSPKPPHGFKKNPRREASTQGLLSRLFILGQSISFLSIPFLSSSFFKENTCIFVHSVCAPQLSSNRINKNLQYMKLIVNCDRKGADSNP